MFTRRQAFALFAALPALAQDTAKFSTEVKVVNVLATVPAYVPAN